MLTSAYVHVKHVRTFLDVMRENTSTYRQRTVSASGFVLLSSVIIDKAKVSLLYMEMGSSRRSSPRGESSGHRGHFPNHFYADQRTLRYCDRPGCEAQTTPR